MKTQILLFSFLCIFAFSVKAQVSQLNGNHHPGSEQASAWFNPNGSDFSNADRMSFQKYGDLKQPQNTEARIMVPAKRNMFNPSTYAWQWDTIICYTVASGSNPAQRVTRTYNYLGDTVFQFRERRQGSLSWENYARETDAYDSAGNWVYQLQQLWQNNVWVNFQKQEFIFNANGDRVDWKRMMWDSTYWSNAWHYSNHFNSNGLCDTSIYQAGQDSLWVNFWLWLPAYDGNGNDTSVLTKTWINNDWANSNLDNYTYDANGNLFTHLAQSWLNSSWVNNALQSYTWDTAENCITWKYQLWQNNAWENMSCDSSIYDPDGNKIENIRQNWMGGAWVNGHHILYVYDTSHNKLSETSQDWVNGNWRSAYREEYTYDSLGNSLTGIAGHYSYNNTWQPYDMGLCVFADHQQEMVLDQIYRYTAVVDSVLVFVEPERAASQVTLYPNPANSMVFVSWHGVSTYKNGTLTIYDLRGQLILSQQMENETTGIDVSGLKPGVYFVKFSNDQMTRVLKFVKN